MKRHVQRNELDFTCTFCCNLARDPKAIRCDDVSVMRTIVNNSEDAILQVSNRE